MTAAELVMYFTFSLPMGSLLNAWHTGRVLRGTWAYTLMFALVMRQTDMTKI